MLVPAVLNPVTRGWNVQTGLAVVTHVAFGSHEVVTEYLDREDIHLQVGPGYHVHKKSN